MNITKIDTYKYMFEEQQVEDADGNINNCLNLWYIEDIFNDREIDFLINSIDSGAEPSRVVGSNNDEDTNQTIYDTRYRKSQSLYFDKNDSEVNELLNERLHKIAYEVLGHEIPIKNSESPQGQKYEPGGYFNAHFDAFPPRGEANIHHIGSLGNRTYTFMVYLNDVEKGGETNFVRFKNLSFAPKRNTGLLWNNLTNPKDNKSICDYSMHEGKVVEKGNKYIITKWFRNGIPWKV